MPINSTSPADELGMLCESQNQLSTRMEQLLSRFESLTMHLPLPTTPAAATAAAAQQASAFMPLIARVGANGVSTFTPPLSLQSHFPDVEAAVIAAIITHKFKVADLHKLDPTNRNKETAYTFNSSTNQFEVSHRAAREYKNPFSVLIPLMTYFKVLTFHINDNAAMHAFWDYSAHLLKLVAEYECFIALLPIDPTLPNPPIHPNTDPHANAPLASTKHLTPISSSLNKLAWAHYLQDYPDCTFVKLLLQIIRFGANLGFAGDCSTLQQCTNLKIAFANASTISAISADIANQVTNGCTHGLFDTPPFSNFRALPIRAVTCKRSSKVQRIHHLSWPDGSSVNNGIADSEATIIYDMVKQALNDLIASGPGSLMLKLDLEVAFRHIPVCQEDWPLLGFEWLGKLYFDVILAFGGRSALYIFNLFAEALHWILQCNIPARVHHYLNDSLKIFLLSIPHTVVNKSLEWAADLATQLGLRFQPSKIVGPDTCIEFLGLELDSIAMKVCLLPAKLKYLQDLTSLWAMHSSCTLRELDKLTGYLQFVSQVIPLSRAFI
ncbi:hypothetical protein E4T56_gene8156 [Termitomyces sp. T112]|nr:hypothetical protein E4T56_gene8156 [Termitomyces sp. T112]